MIPVATLQPAEQVSVAVELCPAVSTCEDDKYQNTIPLVVVPLRVAVTGAVMTKKVAPVRIKQGVVPLHNAPSVCIVPEVLLTLKSSNWAAIPAPAPFPPSWLQKFVAVHPYRFWPAGALLSKNISPVEHVAGIAVLTFDGFVELAPEKSTCFDWEAMLIWV